MPFEKHLNCGPFVYAEKRKKEKENKLTKPRKGKRREEKETPRKRHRYPAGIKLLTLG